MEEIKEKKILNDLNKERNDRCIPIAKEIIKIVGEADLTLGDLTHEESIKCYEPIYVKAMLLMRDKNVYMKDIAYILSLVMQPFDQIKNLTSMSQEANAKVAQGILWGKDIDKITTQDVDNILKGELPKPMKVDSKKTKK